MITLTRQQHPPSASSSAMTGEPRRDSRQPPGDLDGEVADLGREVARLRHELAESGAREDATAEILRIIAGSTGEMRSTGDAVIRSAVRLGGALRGSISCLEGDDLTLIARDGSPPDPATLAKPADAGPDPDSLVRRALRERRTVHLADVFVDSVTEFPETSELLQRIWGHRSVIAVPLVGSRGELGAITLIRADVRPFTDRDIVLLETFADQLVIAIENARLFSELADLNRTLEARVREQVDELERVGRLRCYLSPQVADLIVASGDESILESHRRQVTVVFCDLRGFTPFAENAEPDEVMGVLSEYHAAMGALIHQYGGTLDSFAGTG